MKLANLALLLLLFTTASVCKIVYLASVIRHGARYPLSNMFDGNETKAFHGKLTSVGMRQHFLLGGYIKADYIDKLKLINETLYPKEVEVFSDSSERCVLSTLSHLVGLFPFGTGPRLPEGIKPENLNPPFDSFIKESLRHEEPKLSLSDYALKFGFQPTPYINASQFIPSCPNENSLLTKRIQSLAKQVAEFQVLQAAFTEKMRDTFNLKTSEANIAGLAELYDVVICDLNLGRNMPSAFTDYDFKQLKYVQNYLFDLVYGGSMAPIFSTAMAEGILSNMENRVTKGEKQTMKYSLYSGHDTNVVPLLNFFNLTSPQCITRAWKNETVKQNCAQVPPFASNLLFELHENEDTNKFTVKIRYNGDYYNVCGSNSKQCDYQEFASRTRAQFVDWRKLCGVKTTATTMNSQKVNIMEE